MTNLREVSLQCPKNAPWHSVLINFSSRGILRGLCKGWLTALHVCPAGKVDEGSPAAAAGLRAHDIIVEINGTSVSRENHKQIVDRIKSSGDSVTLLVVDEQCKVEK